MKKLFLVFIILFILSFISFGYALAADCPDSGDPSANGGIVNCGISCSCTIKNIFSMLGGIYSFLVLKIATPLAVLAVIIGGVLMMISAGNPNLEGLGKKILYSAIIGLVLAFCSYLIIDTILKAVGFSGGLGSISI